MGALLIRKMEGDFENVLVRDVETRVAAHVQIPAGEQSRRVVVAMPAGKAALCFETEQAAGWVLEGGLAAFGDEGGQSGVEFVLASDRDELSIPISSILLNHTLMARFGVDPDRKNENRLRDAVESGEIREIESNMGMVLRDLYDRGVTVGPRLDSRGGRAGFARRSLDGRHEYRLELAGEGAAGIRESGGCLRVSKTRLGGGARLRLRIRASTDFERLTPVPLEELLNEKGMDLFRKDPAFAEAIRNVEFLSFREKYLAGSWNFLSYFGRDTLISLRILWPVLSAGAKQTGIQSVANEIAEDGVVNVTDEWTDDRAAADAIERFFREYDQGRLDGARPILERVLDGTVAEHPFLDVLDSTFMYPCATAHWFREMDDGGLSSWLKKEHAVLGRTESNLATLLRNWNYALRSASAYIEAWKTLRAKNPGLAARQLIEAHREEFAKTAGALVESIAGAANWRDTYNLPWHFRSEDINVDLLPMAIEAIEEMVGRIRGLGWGGELVELAKGHSLGEVSGYAEEPVRFEAAKEAWNWDSMREHFLVRRSVGEMRRDLERHLEGLEKGEATRGDRERGGRERDAILRCREGGVSVSEFLRGDRVPETVKDGIEFTALLLDPEGERLPIMQSDDVFLLLFGHPTLEQYRKIVRPFARAYPFGLGFWEDDVGFAISQAAYSPKDHPALKDPWKNTWVKFGPDEYHGRVAWPWALFALVGGTHDQALRGIDSAGKIGIGVTREDVELFRTLLEKARKTIAKLGPLATSEVYGFSPARSGTGTWQAGAMGISTPIQLWSAAPAHLLIDEALARIDLSGR